MVGMNEKEFDTYTEAHAFLQHTMKTGNTKYFIGNDLVAKKFTVYWS